MGWIWDDTRSRWGRRRPWVLVGGPTYRSPYFPLLWLGQAHWTEFGKLAYLVGTGLVFYTTFTVWVMAFTSMLTEMTPDTDERTSISAYFSISSAEKFPPSQGTWVWSISPATRSLTSPSPARRTACTACGWSDWRWAWRSYRAQRPFRPFSSRNGIPSSSPDSRRSRSGRISSGHFKIFRSASSPYFSLIFAFGIDLVQGQMFYLRTLYALKGDDRLWAEAQASRARFRWSLEWSSIALRVAAAAASEKRKPFMVSTVLILIATWSSWFSLRPGVSVAGAG